MIDDHLSVIQDLKELIEAIDRRSPQLHRCGEVDIADAALQLRIQAQSRLAELQAMSQTETVESFET